MATKGASNRYPTGRRGKNGKSISHINYQWARNFNKRTLKKHFINHGLSMKFASEEVYRQHAIKFANTIDKKNNVSFIDRRTGSTYKFSKTTGEFAIITKNGVIVTYFIPDSNDKYGYYKKQKLMYGKGGKRNEKI